MLFSIYIMLFSIFIVKFPVFLNVVFDLIAHVTKSDDFAIKVLYQLKGYRKVVGE